MTTPQQTSSPSLPAARLPGLAPEATPMIGIGLGLTGLAFRLQPRLAAVPLALTALAALLYRDPQRRTPAVADQLFAVADGTVLGIEEVYEHRFLHTEALRLRIAISPLDVPILRSPANGIVRYLEYVPGGYASVLELQAVEQNERRYLGIQTAWGPLLIVQIAGPLARRLHCQVTPGQPVEAGERLGQTRFGAAAALYLPCDLADLLVRPGQHLLSGITSIARLRVGT